ncbi:GGDEF and EAL domain-containing protein [Pseudomonas capeferrum]|uniref:bifunctional diguanylate cyclase/phosphodiesterase n=1 Tax=Pseudomonas capeferrum TaxID=1495066 RepID=UPI0015E29710|nr:GGDEF and EAL domain-containing protein [Pseudomonas capeferrum]MBA1200715.1 GGDEF and EAL domain-containing protein [Pseudomonas capeferrum]
MTGGPPIPIQESKRLAALSELCLFESQGDVELDAMVNMAARAFKVPICLVSIVSSRQQWFKARAGLAAASTSRDVSFCAYTILQKQPLEIPDATCDPRFLGNPLVTGEPGIRYYCGAPLITEEGLAIGSLCLIDTVGRPAMSESDKSMLVGFADLVMKILTGIRLRNFVDQPTGLMNRMRLHCDVEDRLAQQGELTLLVVDIMTATQLSGVVTALGYNFAHDLILSVKDLIVGQLCGARQLYKISPTRFGFVLPEEVDIDSACAGLVQALTPPVECHGVPVTLDAGIGVLPISRGPDHDLDWLRVVVSAADQARRTSRRWAFYEPKVDAAQRRALILLGSLSQALASTDQLHLVYQPKVDLQSGECRSVEALLRWDHPQLGPVSPAEFIPLAEKTALITDISFWVLTSVIQYLKRCPVEGLAVSMNITARDLENPLFMDRLLEAMAYHQIEPTRIELEFTEGVLIEQPDMVDQQLQRARRVGIGIAIDDFGTGYSNWAYLSRIPATMVKLDKTLVQKVSASTKDALLVKTLIELAGKLGYQVAAEGIETPQMLAQVKAWGCAQGQGFYLARPMSEAAFERWHAQLRPQQSWAGGMLD